MTEAVQTFFAAWSIADADARRDMIAGAIADTVSYADPRTATPLTELNAVNDYVGMFAQAAPGATASVIKSDTQAGVTRATVAFAMADGMVQHGQYFVEYDGDKISRMVGFVGTGTPE